MRLCFLSTQNGPLMQLPHQLFYRDNLHSACIELTATENGAPLATLEDAAAALEEAFLTTDAALLKK